MDPDHKKQFESWKDYNLCLNVKGTYRRCQGNMS